MAAITVPMRPLDSAPVSAGISAYVAPAQMRTARPDTRPRDAKYILQAANGTPSTTMTVTASWALPNSKTDKAKTSIKYGAAGVIEPGPILCQASLYEPQRSPAPGRLGNSAPPCSTPSPHHSVRIAIKAKIVSTAMKKTLGLTKIRRSRPGPVESRYAASSSTGPESIALTEALSAELLVVAMPATNSRPCRACAQILGLSARITE